jgi:hypothetical protein
MSILMKVTSFDFVAVARCPSTRPAPAAKALTPAGFAIQGNNFILPQMRDNAAYPAAEGSGEFFRVYYSEDPGKSVVRGDAMLKAQILSEPIELDPFLNLDKVVGTRQNAAYSNHQQFPPLVLHLPCLSWIQNPDKDIRHAQFSFCLHDLPQKDRKIHKSEHCEQPLS